MLIGIVLGLAFAELSRRSGWLSFSSPTEKECGDKMEKCTCYNKDSQQVGYVALCLLAGVVVTWGLPKILASSTKSDATPQFPQYDP
jgi:hypothetical protein